MEPKHSNLPPQNIEAESSILGGLLLNKDSWDQVSDVLRAEDFYRPVHKNIFSAIEYLQRNGKEVDIITVQDYLRSKGEFEEFGPSYLVDLIQNTINISNISGYSEIVREKAILRQVIKACADITQRAFHQDFESIDSFVDSVEGDILRISDTRESAGLIDPATIVCKSVEKLESLFHSNSELTGLSTGFSRLDKMTSGLHPGEMTIVAARPSMGKTAFSLNMAQHVALRLKKAVAYFSVEMSKESMMMRILASEAKIDMEDIRGGRVPEAHWPKLIAAASMISESHLYIDDTSSISPAEIRARCRRFKKAVGLDLIMIDYLQIMDLKKKVESRERMISEISRSLKAIAKELQVPIIALAQLNRAVETRQEKRPMLSDLRESGSIEQDADVILMLWRQGYYDQADDTKKSHAELIIGKQRNGPTGNLDLRWEAKYGRFYDAEDLRAPPPPSPIPLNSHLGQTKNAVSTKAR